MLSLIEVLEARIGIAEIAGKAHNPAILEMWKDSGHPETRTDEEHWCSAAMCSAAKAAGLPMPPVNVNPMARSWLTWGVRVEHANVERGDVIVWPRGKPGSVSGHVNCVAEVKRTKNVVKVRCVGGNQSDPSGGAITLTGWVDIKGALPNGARRPVAPTVADLRKAGSSTIKDADSEGRWGAVAVFFTPVVEGTRAVVEGMFGSVSPPQFSSLPVGLTWWSTLLEVAGRVWGYAVAHPWMAAILLVGIGMVVRSQIRKRGRVVEHANGVPLGSEVAKLQGA